MKKHIIIFLLTLFNTIYGQNKLETINDFLDGYAWKDATNDKSLMVFYKNNIYTFKTDSKDNVVSGPILYKSYRFSPRNIFSDNELGGFKITPIELDSLSDDKVLIFSPPVNSAEVFYVEDRIVYFKKKYYSNTMYTLEFFQGNRNEIILNIGWRPVTSTIIYRERIITPPNSIQVFIKELKKDALIKIKSNKSFVYKVPNIITQIYLLKGDEVEILDQKNNWLKIRYYGKKTIEGWIKKEDVSNN